MPRQDQQQTTARPLQAQQVGGRQVRSQVAATAADNIPNYIPPMRDPDLAGFLEGLSQFKDGLQRHAADANETAASQGRLDAAAGKEQQQGGGAYAQAYFGMDGAVKAQKDAASLVAKYNTEFDKDKGDLEGWIAENFQQNLRGISDDSFISSYNKGMTGALASIREAHVGYQKKAVETRVESNAMQLIDTGVRSYVMTNQPLPPEYIEKIQNKVGSELGVSNQRFQELLFESVRRIGDDGHYEAYDVLKQPRSDGSPGLYFDPAWKHKIDQAELHSFTASQQRAHALRDQKQNEALYPVFAEEDPKKAQELFNNLKKSGLFTRADDLIKWDKLLTEKIDGKPDANQLEAEGSILAKVYQGGVSYKQVLDANARGDITSGQRKYLLSEIRRVNTENRTLANAEGKKEEAIFKTTEFRSAEDFLQGMLKPRPKDNMDFTGQGNEFDRAQLATARLELYRATKGKDASEIQPIVEEIVTRYMKRRKEFTDTQQSAVGQNQIPFKSLQEARDAAAKGLLSPAELRNYIQYFKQGK